MLYRGGVCMNPLYQNILELTKDAILHDNTEPFQEPVDLQQLYSLLCRGKVQGIVYRTAYNLLFDENTNSQLFDVWKKNVIQNGVAQLAATQEIGHVLTSAEKIGLSPVLFKGLVLASLYPEPSMRFTSDADLFIPHKQRSAMEELLLSLGYTMIVTASKDHVPVYCINNNNRCLSIELHDCLWEDYTGLQADILESLDLANSNSLITISPFGFPICTLGHTEHLIYQLFHIAKHFSFEGMRLRFLTDITLFINAYKNEIDFPRFWEAMNMLGYTLFCCSILKICSTYLGLDKTVILPEYKDILISDELIDDILLAGKITKFQTENWASTDMLANYFMHNSKASSGTKRKFEIFFPMPSDLKDKFSYARKYPFLLPIAWIHRFFSALHYSILCKSKKYSASDVLSNAEYRLTLMKSFGLVDTK